VNFATHLESAVDGTRFDLHALHTTHLDRPLWVAYDLPRARKTVRREHLAALPPDMWRYHALLPVPGPPVSLGEVMTPLLWAPRLGEALGVQRLLIKDESRLPTGSFKARGMAVAITMACAYGVRTIALPSQGNAAGAAAAYAARAGIDCHVFLPRDAPEVNRLEAEFFGAKVELVDGLIGDCAARVREGAEREGWFDLGTLREPYRLEGKKTMGYELAEQLDWRLPDVIVYPTGGGTGLIGSWKTLGELRQLGLVRGETRLYAVQGSGCAPIVRAFQRGETHAEKWDDAATEAWGLRVPGALGDFLILEALRESGGGAIAVDDDAMRAGALELGAAGIGAAIEGGATLAAARALHARGDLRDGETVVLFNTAHLLTY
jgi:threonine synthase